MARLDLSPQLRLFIALPIPAPILEACIQLQVRLRPGFRQLSGLRDRLHWVQPDNFHITVRFLGDTPREQIPEILLLLESLASQTPVFELELSKLDAFPQMKQAHVLIWRLKQSEALLHFYERLNHRLQDFGIAEETRNYVPHITLARIKPPQELPIDLAPDEHQFLSASAILYQTEIKSKNSLYTPLGQVLFRKN